MADFAAELERCVQQAAAERASEAAQAGLPSPSMEFLGLQAQCNPQTTPEPSCCCVARCAYRPSCSTGLRVSLPPWAQMQEQHAAATAEAAARHGAAIAALRNQHSVAVAEMRREHGAALSAAAAEMAAAEAASRAVAGAAAASVQVMADH